MSSSDGADSLMSIPISPDRQGSPMSTSDSPERIGRLILVETGSDTLDDDVDRDGCWLLTRYLREESL